MSFTQELTCRWSTSTWTPTRLLPARSCAQKLLHRSCCTGVRLTSRWSNCIWTPANQTSPVLLSPSGGRDSQAVAYETLPSAACWTPKRVAKCGSYLSLGNPLRRSCVSDGQACGVVKCETSLPAATVCGDRAFRTPKHVVARAAFCRDRAGRTFKHVAKCKFGGTRCSPFARNDGQPSKPGVKLLFWKFRCKRGMKVKRQLWENWFFFNVRCKRSRIGVKLRLYPFWNVRHNRFTRNKTCVKLRFYKVRRNPFR